MSHDDADPTAPLPQPGQETTATTEFARDAAEDTGPTTPTTSEPEWITGPSSSTLLAGLLTLVVAALAIVRLSTDVDLDWSIAVPVTVIAVGLIAVVLGAASFSRRSRPAPHGSTE